MLKNVFYISGSIIVFFAGMICYGFILNMNEIPLKQILDEKGLNEINKDNVKIVVDRKNYKLELYYDKELIKTYKAVFGKNSGDVKKSANDYITPIGNYRICAIDTNYKYHKFLRLTFPNDKDAAEALKRGYINMNEYNLIIKAYENFEYPIPETRLSASIGIHGIGEYDFIFKNLPFTFNWTNGSIAVSNDNIDELYSMVKIGTPVKINY